MQFDPIPVQAVKSISQRNIAMHWQKLHARLGLPQFGNFSPGDRAHDPRQLLLWAIDEGDGSRSYRPLYGGAYVYEAFGPDASLAVLPEPLHAPFEAGMNACVTSANIIYMSIATFDAAGHRVDGERMLLPFGRGGRSVTHVLASLQLVSVEGTFQRSTIVQQFEKRAEVTFCGSILPSAPATAQPVPSQAGSSRNAG